MVAVKRNCKDIEECLHPAGHQLKPATFPTLAPNVSWQRYALAAILLLTASLGLRDVICFVVVPPTETEVPPQILQEELESIPKHALE